jgi:hypothetical protein
MAPWDRIIDELPKDITASPAAGTFDSPVRNLRPCGMQALTDDPVTTATARKFQHSTMRRRDLPAYS